VGLVILPKGLIALTAAPAALGGRLVALEAIHNDALSSAELPVRVKLLNWGSNETTTKGVVKVGKKTLAALAANQARYGFDRIALDYNHNSLPGHPNFQPDPRKVGAYGKPVVVEGDGLYLEALGYTPSGKEHAREYSDLSPTPLLDESGEVVFLHSVALCPQGEVKGLTFLSTEFLTIKPLSRHMAVVASRKSMDYKTLLCTLLGLDPQTATDDDIQNKAESHAKALDDKGGSNNEETPGTKETPDSSPEKAVALAVNKILGPILEQIKGFTTKSDASERAAIKAEALSKGKLIPLSAEKLPLDVYRQLVSELPEGTVPVEQRTPEDVTSLSAGGVTDANAQHVMKALGITEEEWKGKKKAA
jgi:phage I-like protein